MRALILLLIPLGLFIGAIAVWAFRITAGLGGLPLSALGAVGLLAGGAAVLIGVFAFLIRYRAGRGDRARNGNGRYD